MENLNNKVTTPPLQKTKDPTNITVASPTKDYRKPWISYAKALGQKSLISPSEMREQNSSVNSSQDVEKLSSYQARPIIRGAGDFSIVYDVTGKKLFQPDLYRKMKETIPSGMARGLKSHTEGNKILIEFMLKDEATCDFLLNQSIEIGDVTLKGTRTLPRDSEIVHLRLRDLPYDDPSELEAGLMNALGNYGKVINVSLHHEIHGGFFLGTGVATLDITPPSDSHSTSQESDEFYYKPLDHILLYNDSRIIVEWNKMPLFCRYCLAKGHAVAHCPNKTKPQCWNCGEYEHVRSNCPLKQQHNSRKKPKLNSSSKNTKHTGNNEAKDPPFTQSLSEIMASGPFSPIQFSVSTGCTSTPLLLDSDSQLQMIEDNTSVNSDALMKFIDKHNDFHNNEATSTRNPGVLIVTEAAKDDCAQDIPMKSPANQPLVTPKNKKAISKAKTKPTETLSKVKFKSTKPPVSSRNQQHKGMMVVSRKSTRTNAGIRQSKRFDDEDFSSVGSPANKQ